jgi:hypothetical protein
LSIAVYPIRHEQLSYASEPNTSMNTSFHVLRLRFLVLLRHGQSDAQCATN